MMLHGVNWLLLLLIVFSVFKENDAWGWIIDADSLDDDDTASIFRSGENPNINKLYVPLNKSPASDKTVDENRNEIHKPDFDETDNSIIPKLSSYDQICRLKSDVGNCRAEEPRYYYDIDSKVCKFFIYGGCGGNRNNFGTIEECEEKCIEKKGGDFWSEDGQERETLIPRDGMIRSFSPRQRPVLSGTPLFEEILAVTCKLEPEIGHCRAKIPKYYYDHNSKECKNFIYGGCGGNANRFGSLQECEQMCGNKIALTPRDGMLRSFSPITPKDGMIRSFPHQPSYLPYLYPRYSDRPGLFPFFYPTHTDGWIDFARLIPVSSSTPHIEDNGMIESFSLADLQCKLQHEPGPCRGTFPSYYYDFVSKECKSFLYGGCEGNTNRFSSVQECEQTCGSNKDSLSLPNKRKILPSKFTKIVPIPLDGMTQSFSPEGLSCKLQHEAGPCRKTLSSYYYDIVRKECKLFVYGGCGGNTNRFSSVQECQHICGNKKAITPTDGMIRSFSPRPRYLPYVYPIHTDWWIHSGTPNDMQHLYSRYSDMLNPHPYLYRRALLDTAPICYTPRKDTTTCYADKYKYLVDAETNKCKYFSYAGCSGIPEGVKDLPECKDICIEKEDDPSDSDTIPLCYKLLNDPRDCFANVYKYNVDDNRYECRIYGCAGNPKRLKDLPECKNLCSEKKGAAPICYKPKKDTSKCYADKYKYWYNAKTKECKHFVDAGCAAIPEEVKDLPECKDVCTEKEDEPSDSEEPTDSEKLTDSEKPTDSVRDPICYENFLTGRCDGRFPSYYYDYVSKECKTFIYGGCGGNGNRFQSAEECEEKCGNKLEKPTDSETAKAEVMLVKTIAKESAKEPRNTSDMPNHQPYLYRTDSDTVSICYTLRKDTRICYANIFLYTVEDERYKCRYYGCANNPEDVKDFSECKNLCDVKEDNAPICYTPTKDTVTCNAYKFKYYADAETKECKHFSYVGCATIPHGVKDLPKCKDVCIEKEKEDTVPLCYTELKDKRVCVADVYKYDVNDKTKVCRMYGCAGNLRRLKDLPECENLCILKKDAEEQQQKAPGIVEELKKLFPSIEFRKQSSKESRNPPVNVVFDLVAEGHKSYSAKDMPNHQPYLYRKDSDTVSICYTLRKDTRVCYANIFLYTVEDETYKCRYYGCANNPEEVKDLTDCKNACDVKEDNAPICYTKRKDTVTCYADKFKYYADAETKKCKHFSYAGCATQGVQDLPKCKDVCIGKEKEDEPSDGDTIPLCYTELKDTGVCFANIYLYDVNDKTKVCRMAACAAADYGGLKTLPECKNLCILKKDAEEQQHGMLRSYSDPRKTPVNVVLVLPAEDQKSYSENAINKDTVKNVPRYEFRKESDKAVPLACRLDRDRGQCFARFPSYYYDYITKECKFFIYGGCGGNANRFRSVKDCEQKCRNKIETVRNVPKLEFREEIRIPIVKKVRRFNFRKESDKELRNTPVNVVLVLPAEAPKSYSADEKLPAPLACRLDRKRGHCFARFPAYYYDYITKECKFFIYGGCGGNANRFRSVKECEQICHNKTETVRSVPKLEFRKASRKDPRNTPAVPLACRLDRDRGHCYARFPSYYYDYITKECKFFIYGGCGGNANRFQSVKECEQKCRNKIAP